VSCPRNTSFSSLGLVATTAPFGAGKWRDEFSSYLRGKKIIIYADNDEPGKNHAQDIIASLIGKAEQVKLLTFSGLPTKGADVADWLKDNGKDELLAKIKSLSPIKELPNEEISTDETPILNTVDDRLEEQYGPLIMFDKDGNPTQLNQMFVAAKYAVDNMILHEPSLNLFYEYEAKTGLWVRKTETTLVVGLGHALRDMLNEYHANCLLKKRSQNLLGQILRLLKGTVERPDIFHRANSVIHVGNGVLHLDANPPTLNEFSPDYYSRNRSEICYDESAECSRFLDDLLRPALDDDDIALLQKYAGQCLIGRNLSQKFLLLRGTPGGGKSTLANVLEAIIGPYNAIQLRIRLLDERFEIAGFVGKTLLCGKDVPGNFLNSKSAYVLKALVGGDRLDAEQKNVKHRFELVGEFNVIITSNSRLHLKLDADAGAWKRRMLIVDYEQPSVSRPIPNFDRLLIESEGPGILNWCIAGALDLLDELDATGKFQLTDTQMGRVDALLCESDGVRHFIIEMVEPKHGTDVTVNELQTAYHNFCEEQGWQAVTIRQFENQVSNIMMEVHRVAKRTDIKRNDKPQRGFMHMVIKDSN
jgi:P4 family phage/plasmid primase-like protien